MCLFPVILALLGNLLLKAAVLYCLGIPATVRMEHILYSAGFRHCSGDSASVGQPYGGVSISGDLAGDMCFGCSGTGRLLVNTCLLCDGSGTVPGWNLWMGRWRRNEVLKCGADGFVRGEISTTQVLVKNSLW